MSASDGLKPGTRATEGAILSRLKCLRENMLGYFRLFARKPRHAFPTSALLHVAVGTLAVTAVIGTTMVMVDAPAIPGVGHLPLWLIAWFDRVTDLGRSSWFLTPIALVLLSMAALASPTLSVTSQRVLAAIAIRLGFLFSAIALPGLVVTVLKRLVGRARPLVGGGVDLSSICRSAGTSNMRAFPRAMPPMPSQPQWRSVRSGRRCVHGCGLTPLSLPQAVWSLPRTFQATCWRERQSEWPACFLCAHGLPHAGSPLHGTRVGQFAGCRALHWPE